MKLEGSRQRFAGDGLKRTPTEHLGTSADVFLPWLHHRAMAVVPSRVGARCVHAAPGGAAGHRGSSPGCPLVTETLGRLSLAMED
ncbi:hypothetical protein E2C01_068293 [Portunus trituberculatus]|uniref:Uncharacterized protein n=1 Tax=Portunus trituberculatus TaxID=210409 RepID=A0A5B7HNG9_PORTR|nr:hypothetical protein [Portunus trituberculatus]